MSEGPRRGYIGALVAALLVGAVLRGAWPTSDPPTQGTVGIVWHDEGAWVHNARNRALWGDLAYGQWNPMFIAPVFTALEYGAFRAFGVGTWQARTVPAGSGLFAILMLSLGLAAVAGPRAANVGAALLATNYVFVMWNRAALMESTMTAFIVASWGAYAWAQRRPGCRAPGGYRSGSRLVYESLGCLFRGRHCARRRLHAADFAVALRTAPLWDRSAVTPGGARRGLDAWRHCARHRSRGNRVRCAVLDRVSVLQLADVGDTKTCVQHPRGDGPRFVDPDRSRFLYEDVAGHGGGCPRDCDRGGAMAFGTTCRAPPRAVGAARPG